MALQAVYKQFLAAPNSSALSADASLHYITSTTSYTGATEIIKHLNVQRNQLKKKKEDVIAVVEGRHAIAVELETTLEFVTSGGAFLPGLDDNFLADRTVYLPIMHIVTFDSDNKISQIRQTWDQGALLKQLDVIGRTGRNWPIRDSKDQISLITKCAKAVGRVSSGGDSASVAGSNEGRSRGNSTNILRDPHASLSLFAPREEVDAEAAALAAAAIVSPYAGNRPRQRDFTEILGDEPVDEPDTPSRARSQSPSKAIAPKIGAGRNFQPSRLFEEDETAAASTVAEDEFKSPERVVRPNPKKYQHFDFADGSDPQDVTAAAAAQAGERPKSRSKHDSTWSFDDFNTPSKPTAGKKLHRTQDVRHWGTEENAPQETPARRPPQPMKPRRDAETHFEFQDDGLPGENARVPGLPRGAMHNTGLHLYDNNLYNEDGSAPEPGAPVLATITNLKDRRKDFESHFKLTDEQSPSNGNNGGAAAAEQAKAKISDDRAKAVRMMEANWAAYDESPSSQKENTKPIGGKRSGGATERGITIAGDGMGGKKGVAARTFGEEERGITIAGDGMGGKKGSGRAWAIGDVSDEETPQPAKVPGKKPAPAQKAGGSFWDF